tara:strand:+ start:468 stop:1520 length:1053 start_codon:yes stop_codon:yes gene_type:complete
MTIWQIAVGEPHRYFEEIFFEYGVMIMGPSNLGPANEVSYASGTGLAKGNQVNAFANSVKVGDLILARKGKEIIGIGRIHENSSYQFVKQFGCILGWDLCHTWNVSWINDSSLLSVLPNPFNESQRQIATFNQVHNQDTAKFVKNIPADKFIRKEFNFNSDISKQLSYDDVRLKLFERGVSSIQIESVIGALRQCRQLSAWYYANKHSGGRPTEHEVVSHMVLPLLLALGWSHQQIAVEWKRIDVALFLTTPTESQNCVGIIEAKGHGQSLGNVLGQPQGYVDNLKLTNARKVIITDGLNIFIHELSRDTGKFNEVPTGYLNMNYLTESYLLPKGVSAIDTLIQMLPSQF